MRSSGLSQKAYEHVQAKIVSGELTSGAVLSEAKLAEELGISRTPVGEAFRRLALQGFVEQIPRYGTVVRSLLRTDIVELYEIREALEPFATEKIAGDISNEVLHKLGEYCEGMRSISHEMNQQNINRLDAEMLRRFLAYDMAFHVLIIHAAGNERIQKIVDETRSVSRIFQTDRMEHTLSIVQEAERHHVEILSAFKNRDAHLARQLMAEHLRISKIQALEQFDQREKESQQKNGLNLSLPEDLQRDLE